MNAKPILVLRIPHDENMQSIARDIQEVEKKISDWHLLILADLTANKFGFEAFHVGNATDIEIEELKKLVLAECKK